MPAKSKAQFKLMAAAANNPKLAKEKGIPSKTAKEFIHATTNFKELPAKVKKK
jgi:hypothetical protein